MATSVVAGLALIILLVYEQGTLSRLGRTMLPAIALSFSILAFFWEHSNLSRFSGGHPLDSSHLTEEVIPLALVLGFLGLTLKSWRGWLSVIALTLFLDGVLLLFQPVPLVNHLFQLLSVLALIFGFYRLIFSGLPSARLAHSTLTVSGAIGVFCEIGMVYL